MEFEVLLPRVALALGIGLTWSGRRGKLWRGRRNCRRDCCRACGCRFGHHCDGEAAIRHSVARGRGLCHPRRRRKRYGEVAIGAVIGQGRFAAQIGIMATICLSGAAVLGLTLVLPGMRGLLSLANG